MKKKVIFFGALLAFVAVNSSYKNGLFTNNGLRVTGAPGEATCMQSGCHSGGTQATTTTIQLFQAGTTTAVTAFTPNVQYDGKVTITAGTRYGFQMTCLTSSNNVAAGTFATSMANTALGRDSTSRRNYIESNAIGSTGVYTFKWTAPAAGTGTVKFYACGNALDANGNTSGDKATTATLTLTELTTTGVETNQLAGAKITPNPVISVFNFQLPISLEPEATVEIRNLAGQVMVRLDAAAVQAGGIQGHHLTSGLYFASIKNAGQTAVIPFIKD